MLQRPALMVLAAALLLGGCQGIYDDTKGWASRLEASLLDATKSDPEAAETAPETQAAAPDETIRQAAAMTPLPRPDGTPQPILIDPADKRPSDGLLLDSLPSPTEPAPLKEAAAEETPPEAMPAEEKTAEDKTVLDKAAAEVTLAETRLPPLPPRKPELPATAVAAKTQDAPAVGDDHAMVLHLSSLRSEDAAKREWSDLQHRYPEALAGMQAEFRRTELGEQGTFYRVLAGPLPSDSAAKNACAALKAKNAKQYCRVLPPKPKS